MERRIGVYLIEGELGRGGQSIVHRGRAPDGTPVAIKVLTSTGDPQAVLGFARERRLQSSLGVDAGVVPVLDAGLERGLPYLVMPLLSGGDLRARLRHGPLPPGEAVELVRGLATSLGLAHQAGIVHRDLKPENVLFDQTGRPYVTDLGLARHFLPGLSAELSRSGTIAGTPGYMAIEQLEARPDVGPAADVFALGAILFECLTGVRPFPATSALQYASALVETRAPTLAERGCAAPPQLEAIVARALAREPAARFPHAGALAGALAAGSHASPAPALPGPSRRRFALLAIPAALTLAWGVLISLRPAAPAPPHPSSPPPRAPNALCADGEWTRLSRHAGTVNEAVVSPDGRLALTTAEDGTVLVWDLGGERVLARALQCPAPPGPNKVASSGAVWDPRGADKAWVAWSTGIVSELEAEPGREPRWTGSQLDLRSTCEVQGESRAWRLAPGPEGAILAGLHDGRLLEWKPGARPEVAVSMLGPIYGLAFSPRTRAWAAGGQTGQLHVRREGGKWRRRPMEGLVAHMAFVQLGGEERLLVGGVRHVGLLDPLNEWTPLPGHDGRVNAVSTSADGERAYTAGWDGRLIAWDLSGPAPRAEASLALKGELNAVGCDSTGRLVLVGTTAGEVLTFDAAASRLGAPRPGLPAHAAKVVALTLLEHERIFSAAADGSTIVWDRDGRWVEERRYPNAWRALVANPTTPWSVIGLDEQGRLVRDLGSAGRPEPWSPEPGFPAAPGFAVASSSEGLSALGSGGRIYIRRPDGQGSLLGMEGHGEVSALAFSPEGRLWAATTHGMVFWFKQDRGEGVLGQLPPVACLAAGLDGQVLVGTATGQLVLRRGESPERHDTGGGAVVAVAIDPSGERAASIEAPSSGGNQILRCWDLSRQLAPLGRLELPEPATCLLFLDQHQLLVGTEQGRILRYRVE